MDLDYRVVGAMSLIGLIGLLLLLGVGWTVDRLQHRLSAGRDPRPAISAWWRRGILLAAVALLVVIAHIYATQILPADVDRARAAIELTGIEKWVDGISMFEDKVRIRFEYRNRTGRKIESFTAHFRLSKDRYKVIDHQISVSTSLKGGRVSSWTEAYWVSCPQEFTPESWEMLVQRDIRDFDVDWEATAVTFTGGETIN